MTKVVERTPHTPEDLLADEIAELERPALFAWLPWIAGAIGISVLGLAVWGVVALEHPSRKALVHADAVSRSVVEMAEPSGTLPEAPSSFHWVAVDGATSYVVTVRTARGEAILTRPIDRTMMLPTDVERAYLLPGDYTWAVEARDDRMNLMARGEAGFRVLSTVRTEVPAAR